MGNTKKIILYHEAITNPGGAERLVLEEYNFLKRIGFTTKILTFSVRREALFNYKDIDLEILKDGAVLDEGIISKGFNVLQRAIILRKRLDEINPDLVISASGFIELYLATLFTSIPYILHIHGSLFWFESDLLKYALIHRGVFCEIRESVKGHKEFIPPKPRCSPFHRALLEIAAFLDYLAVKKAKEIIVLTPQVQWEIEKLYRRRPVIARGCLNPSIFNYKPKEDIKQKLRIRSDAQVILSVSRLDHRKRIDVLIKSFAKSCKNMGDKILIIIGTGPDEKRLKSLAKQLNCSNNIRFTGFVSDDKLWDYYYSCDVFASPGWTTSPITTYEALAFNKKVVWSSEASEPDEILNDPHVFPAAPDSNSFAVALQNALNTKVMMSTDLGKYTWNIFFEKTCNIIKAHLKNGKTTKYLVNTENRMHTQAIVSFYNSLTTERESFALPLPELLQSNLLLVERGKNGEIMGTAGISSGKSFFLVVKRNCQNHKIGQKLTQKVIDLARRRSYHYLTLNVFQSNSKAIHIYRKFGFEILFSNVVGSRKNCFMILRLDSVGTLYKDLIINKWHLRPILCPLQKLGKRFIHSC